MSEDIFSIKDIRDIVLSFPESQTLGGSTSDDLLIPSAATSGFLLRQHVIQQFNQSIDTGESSSLSTLLEMPMLTRVANKRFSPQDVAKRLDLDLKAVITILGERDAPLSYSLDKQFIIPRPELERITEIVSELASKSFVSLGKFCKDYDINSDSLLDAVRNLNIGRAQHSQVGTGRWYEGDDTPSGSYLYSTDFLDHVRDEISSSLRETSKEAEYVDYLDASISLTLNRPKTWNAEDMHGLGAKSFKCFVKNIASTSDDTQGQVVVSSGFSTATFTPTSFLAKEIDHMVDSLPGSGYLDLKGLILRYPTMYTSVGSAASMFTERYTKDAVVLGSTVLYSPYWLERAEAHVEELLKVGYLEPQVRVLSMPIAIL